jgi:hypothetical protein
MAFSNQRKKGKTSTTPCSTTPSSITSTSTAPYSTAPPSTESAYPPARPVFYNLAVKQKAVCQRMFKHRRWMQESKAFIPPGLDDSITDIESRLPPVRGSDANVMDYLQDPERVQERLDDYSNGDKTTFKHHRWDARQAREEEFRTIANRPLGPVGGRIGAKRDPANLVVIGIGLGQFSSKTRLSSPHGPFMSFFVQLVSPYLFQPHIDGGFFFAHGGSNYNINLP